MRIEVDHLTIKYQEGTPFETVALEDVSFAIEEGEFCSIIGHTGSGKTTLVHTIAQQHKFKGIGLVFQYPEYQLFEETVLKDVCFGPKNQGFDEAECIRKAENALTICGIDPKEKGEVSPFGLSGGEKRRVAIAGVLAMEPSVLILDEPTAGLDPKGHSDILHMIEKIRKDRNITIILVSHNMDDVANLSDHVLVMDSGKLVLDGTPNEVFKNVEFLKSIGLGAPMATEFLAELQSREKACGRDIEFNENVFTADEAADMIFKQYSKFTK